MLKNVRVGERLRLKGITENHRAFPLEKNLRVFGGDTETVRGEPHTIQLVGPRLSAAPGRNGGGENQIIQRVTSANIFRFMMEWLEDQVILGGVNLVWFHNLRFDLTILFRNNLESIFEQYNDIRLERDGYVVKMLYGKVNNATIWKDLGGYLCPKCPEPVPETATSVESGKRVCTRHRLSEPAVRRNLGAKVTLLDSAAFCPPGSKSFDAALKIYGVPHKKLPHPKGLGERRLWTKEFRDYAMGDAIGQRKLGLAIVDTWKKYDVTTCVSLPQMAGRVLRHHFFHPKEVVQFPPEAVRLASEFSYHAGKNGMYVPRGVYEDVYEYDINSAFPKAMKELPQMVKGRFRKVKKFCPGKYGVYRISGSSLGRVKYPAIFDHLFRPIPHLLDGRRIDPAPQRFWNVWVTGFEVECLLGNPDYKFDLKSGWVWEPETSYKHSPLSEYVDHFWRLKSHAPKGPLRDLYKNLLNSLYGKFAACVEKRPMVLTAFGPQPINDPKDAEQKHFMAGALYHPFIATQITGYVRRDLFRLEKTGGSLHSATDSIKSFRKLPTSDDLGGVKLEVFGRCYLFRTKCYLHFAKDASLCGHGDKIAKGEGWINGRRSGEKPISIFDGADKQHLCKWATHGFKGSVGDLYARRNEILEKGFIDYEYQHMVSLREGFLRGEDVSTMVRRLERLQMPNEIISSDDEISLAPAVI